MKMKIMLVAGLIALAIAVPNQAFAQSNLGPPAGAIYSLDGTLIPGGGNNTYQLYTVDFSAGLSNTAITFAFRDDPAYILFSDASVTDLTTGGATNLLLNGDFSQGQTDWTYANQYGASFGGEVSSGCGYLGGNCWGDGAVQAYDAISQTIGTTAGDEYQISFYVAEDSNCTTNGGAPCNFSALSTNGNITGTGGNGINVAVYAQAGLPPPSGTPEPGSLTLLSSGLLGLGWKLRKGVRSK
jgi:hypothetical protein